MWHNLMAKLWNDDCGAVITAEYMMLFGVVALGAAQGLTTLRDTTNSELQEVSNLARETRIAYSPQLPNARPQQQQKQPTAYTPLVGQSAPAQCIGGMCP